MSNEDFDTLDGLPTIQSSDGGESKILAGRYRILRKLGEGGMGLVYLAEDTELGNEKVAIKFIPPMLASNERAIKNLKKEAQTARQLSHPNIVRLHDLHTDGHQKFLVMEYIEGKTLEQALTAKENDKFTLQELLPVAEQIAAGLEYAHKRKVLHRDLKPSNIMIAKDGTVKLLDFGIAREMKDSYTRVTGKETSGTLPYMSPDQLMGEPPTIAMDVYSFGAVLYECLSSRPPFYMGDIREQIKSKTPATLPGVSSTVNDAVLSSLAKDPAQRPQKPTELMAMLRGEKKSPAYKDTLDYSKTISTKLEKKKSSLAIGVVITVSAMIVLGIVFGLYKNKTETTLLTDLVETVDEMQVEASKLWAEAKDSAQRGDFEEAIRIADKLLTDYAGLPETKEAVSKKPFWQKALAAQKEPEQNFRNLLDAAFICEAKEDWEKAIEGYKKALAIKDDAETKDKLAACQHNLYLQKAQTEEAEGNLDNAIDYYTKAQSFKQVTSTQIKLDAAKKVLQEKIETERKKLEYDKWVAQAETSEKQGNLSAAVKFYKKAQDYTDESLSEKINSLNQQIAEKEKQTRFNQLLASAKANDNKTDGKQALDFLKEALAIYPENSEALALQKKIHGYYGPNPGDVITNSIGMKLIYIPMGTFTMGSPSNENQRYNDEGPRHKITVSKGFYMGIYEVTQAQYQAVTGSNPSYFKGDSLPVERVSWDGAVEFCKKLTQRDGKTYRLPTEAEWEYACRAGRSTRFCCGDSDSDLSDYAWYSSNKDSKTHPVGQKRPNDFGLYDMHGNVWEWCQDWYDANYYGSSPDVDPQGASSGQYRVLRGGSWCDNSQDCRSATRHWSGPSNPSGNFGFRAVCQDPY